MKKIGTVFVILFVWSLCSCKNAAIPSLQDSDFSVTDTQDHIVLGSMYRELSLQYQELPQDTNFVGEIVEEDVLYKYYFHEYEDVTIYTTNYQYDKNGRNASDYQISQIVLKTPVFQTARGIAVGATVDAVQAAYGEGQWSQEGEDTVISYALADREISFVMDQQKRVKLINLTQKVPACR